MVVKIPRWTLMMAMLATSRRERPRWWAGPLFVLLGVLAAMLLAGLSFFSAPAGAQDAGSTFTVDSTADDADAKVGTGGCATAAGACTLRAAIQEANKHSGPDTIAFNIPGEGVQTIQLTKGLPKLTDTSGPTTIDGYTQPGSSANTDPLASNASIKVEIKGTGTVLPADGGITALDIASSGNTVRGLAFYDLYRAIRLQGSGSDNNHITGNFIGTNAAATHKAPTKVQFANGIHITGGAASNVIGGTSAAERNVISGNGGHGVGMYVAGTDSNVVAGNLIGLHPSGTKGWSNKAHGVDINTGASNNRVGGDSPEERNVISGNQEGVEVSHGGTTNGFPTNNQVIGNFVGTDVTGELVSADLANDNHGVHAQDSVRGTIIRNNVIGNSVKSGVGVGGPRTIDTKVYDNLIGISPNGAAIPNGSEGIRLNSAKHSQIGPNNVITNNPIGIVVNFDDADFNTLTRNSIYANTNLGIDIQPTGKKNNNDVGDVDTKANEQLNYPVLQSATQATVSGTACAEAVVPKPCTVEIFKADGGAGVNGEGKTFVGSSTTNSDGTFTVSVSEVNVGDYVTATATDATGNTSEFSPNLVVPDPNEGDTSPPEVSQPTQFLTTGSTLSTISTLPVKISWSATDSDSGVAGYEVQQSVDGGAWTDVALSSATATSIKPKLEAGKTYRFQVRAQDQDGNWSEWKQGSSFKLNLLQESAGVIGYTGTSWSTQSTSSASGGALKYASASGNSAKLTFTGGLNVGWVSPKGLDRGKAEVWVDGAKKDVDLYYSKAQSRRVVFSENQLDPSVSHTVEVRVLGAKSASSSGTRVDVDAFVVLEEVP